jgi:hypothetical protein
LGYAIRKVGFPYPLTLVLVDSMPETRRSIQERKKEKKRKTTKKSTMSNESKNGDK